MSKPASPVPTLSVAQASAMLVGIVVGIGIFKTPSIVAANSASEAMFLGLWALGGALTVVGALCYAELSAAHPHAGGEYHYLRRAYGDGLGFLFGWGRMTVMQTGAIAAVAFVYGDYASVVLPLGEWGPALHAALAIAALSGLQLLGTKISAGAQLLLTILTVGGVAVVALVGLLAEPHATPSPSEARGGAAGLAMVFILLTYGGWNETAYLSGEVRDPGRNMARVLLIGTAAVTALYLVVNLALLTVLGLEGLARSETALADLVRREAGEAGAIVLSLIVCATALSTLNATIFTGVRTNFALGRSFAPFAPLGHRHSRTGTPVAALLVQGAITLTLVAFGAHARDGFTAMVEYTAPVFWSFLLLVGVALFLFRWRDGARDIPFRVPLYPVLPMVFCATCAYLLYSSLVYTGQGALVGVAILAAGVPVFLFGQYAPAQPEAPATPPAKSSD